MSAFFEAAFSLPTGIFSVLGILMAIYWVTFLLGLFDLEILDSLFDAFGGAAESIGGAADAAGGALDGAASAAEGLSGAAEGMVQGAAESAAEGLVQSADSVGDTGGCLGLGGVPTIITATAFTAFGWLGSYFGSSMLSQMELTGVMVALAPWLVGGGAVVAAMAVTSISLRPLKKVFRLPTSTTHNDLVGKVCTITTLRVDANFGQAEVLDETGAVMLIQVRSREENTMQHGGKALIFDYDPTTQVFYVAPPRGVGDSSEASTS